MPPDNRTNEPNQNETKSGQEFCFTEAQVLAAAKAIYGDDPAWGYVSDYGGGEVASQWRHLGEGIQEMFRLKARAALVAAQSAASQDSALNPDDMSIMNGYLVLSVNEHTCGTGPDGHYGAHEPGCGYEPLVNLAEIPGYPADAASAMDRVNRLHQTVLRGNSTLGEELEAWCVHCNIPYPCHTMQTLAPVLPPSAVDEDALARLLCEKNYLSPDGKPTCAACRDKAHEVAEWLKEQGRGHG